VMNYSPVTRGARPGDPHLRLRLAAVIAVIAGVILVAAAAFMLSYAGIHQIALQAGVSTTLARLYPLMFDAMLVVTCAAVLALRNAGWGTTFYVWACLLLVLAAVAVGDALHATGVQLTGQAARAAIAVIPWVLLLMGFGIWLAMLRQWRRARAAAASAAETANAAGSGQAGRERPAIEAPAAGAAGAGAVTWAVGRAAAPDRPGPGGPGGGIDTLLQRNAGLAPDRTTTETTPAGTPAPAQEQQRRTSEPGQDRPAAGTAGAAAAGAVGAGAAVSAVGAAGTRQNGATTGGARSQGRGRQDNGEDRGRRTRLGGLLKVPDSKPDEEREEGSVRVLPADPKAPAEGTDTGNNSHTDGAGAQAGDAAKAGDTAHAGDAAQAGDAAKAGDTAHAGDGAKTGDAAQSADGTKTGEAAYAGDGANTGEAADAGDGAETGDTAHAADGAGTGLLSPPPPAAAMAPHFDRLRSSPTPPGETGTGGE